MKICLRVGLVLGLLGPLCSDARAVQAPKPSRKQAQALRRAKTFCVQKAQDKEAEQYLEWAARILDYTALRVEKKPGADCDVVVTAKASVVYSSSFYLRSDGALGRPSGGPIWLETGGEVKGSLVIAVKGASPLALKFQARKAPDRTVSGSVGPDRSRVASELFSLSRFSPLLMALAADIWGPDVLISARRWEVLAGAGVREFIKSRGPAIQGRLMELASMESKDLEPIKKDSVADAFATIEKTPRPCREKFLLEALRRGLAAGRTSPSALGMLGPGVLTRSGFQALKTPQEWLAWGDKQTFPDCANAILP